MLFYILSLFISNWEATNLTSLSTSSQFDLTSGSDVEVFLPPFMQVNMVCPGFSGVFSPLQTFNPDIHQLKSQAAEITPCFCLDLSLITSAFILPAPTYIPCGDSHLPLNRLLVIGLRRAVLVGVAATAGFHCDVQQWTLCHCSSAALTSCVSSCSPVVCGLCESSSVQSWRESIWSIVR